MQREILHVSPFACNGGFVETIAMRKTVEDFFGKRESAGTKSQRKERRRLF